MAGLLSKIAGGVNRFSDELLAPTNPLGKLGMYLGAASGGVLGQASLAHQQDQLSRGDADLDRQYKQAQIAKLEALVYRLVEQVERRTPDADTRASSSSR